MVEARERERDAHAAAFSGPDVGIGTNNFKKAFRFLILVHQVVASQIQDCFID